MNSIGLNINPYILTWAIKRAGCSVEEYAAKNPQFQKWLDGTTLPQLSSIEKFAKKFYLPLGYMFLEEPPKEEYPIPFFRNINKQITNNINVYDTVIELQNRQTWLSSYLRSVDFNQIDFVGKYSNNNTPQEVSNAIYQILGLQYNWCSQFSKIEEALNHITKLIENKGIIVVYNSVVGFNNYRHIKIEDCRGFTLIDEYAPFIYVNSADAKAAQMFTLIHELAHVLTGYSAGVGDDIPEESSNAEKFCDKVAANFLVPEHLLKEHWNKSKDKYNDMALLFKVSRIVIARRALEFDLISKELFFQLYKRWKNEINVTKKNNGGNFFPTAIKKTSRTFLIHVNNALNRNSLLHMDAYKLTGLNGNTFHKVINSQYFV